ncbi:hypothetical protein BH10ACT7_BH10ACT7_07750 [soil metagenome]
MNDAARGDATDRERQVIAAAIERIDALHAGTVPYQADRLFDGDETAAICRGVQLLLELDDSEAGDLVHRLLSGVVVAPTSANTVPSQGLAYGIGNAIIAYPTPESVIALRSAIAQTRHGGVVWKLKRLLKAAEKALPERGDVAIRVPADEKLTPAQLRGFVKGLEGQFALERRWTPEEWLRLFHTNPQATKTSALLVWSLERPDGSVRSFLGPADGGTTADGSLIGELDGEIGLWHPVIAEEEERGAWRDRIWRDRVQQPFRQVFREFYRAGDSESLDAFVGARLDIRPLLGLARSEGWKLDRDTLVRTLGRSRIVLELDGSLYPGAEGSTVLRSITVFDGDRAVAPADLPPVVVSEVLRAVDLLVSVTTIDLSDGTYRGWDGSSAGSALAVRRIVIEHAYATDARVRVEGRHAYISDYDVHLGTARVSRHGEPVELDAPARKRSFVPSTEKLLSLILDRIDALLDDATQP